MESVPVEPVSEEPVESPVTEVEAPIPTLEENGPIDEAVSPVAPGEGNKNKKTGIIAIICAVLLIGLGLVFAYTKYFSAKNIFTKAVDKKYSEFEKWLDDNWKESKTNKAEIISQDIKFNIDGGSALASNASAQSLVTELNKLELKTKVGVDTKNNNLLMNVDTLYDNSELLVLGAYLKDNRYYLELKNLYDKYIEITDLVEVDEANTKLEKEDIKYILSTVEKSFVKNLNEKDFKKSNATITVNGKKVKTSKITYKLTEKTLGELSIKMIEDLQKDSKFIKTLAKVSGVKESEIKDGLKNSIDKIKEDIKDADTKDSVTLNTYVKGLTNKFVGYSMDVKSENDVASLSYFEDGDAKEFKFESDDTVISSITKNNNTIITIKSGEQEYKLTVNKKEEGKTTTYTINVKAEDTTYVTATVVKKEVSSTDSKEEYELSFDAKLMGMVSVKVTDSVSIEYVDSLDMPDTTNSIKVENITESEKEEIMNKLYQNQGFQKLVKNFGLADY